MKNIEYLRCEMNHIHVSLLKQAQILPRVKYIFYLRHSNLKQISKFGQSLLPFKNLDSKI